MTEINATTQTEARQRQSYPSVDSVPPSLDSLPETDPVREFVSRVRKEIKDQVPELYRRDHLVPGDAKSLASSAPDLTNDRLPSELLPYAENLEGFELGLTDLTLLEDFHQARATWLKLGRGKNEATAVTLEGLAQAIAQRIDDSDEVLRQFTLIRDFAARYANPTSVA